MYKPNGVTSINFKAFPQSNLHEHIPNRNAGRSELQVVPGLLPVVETKSLQNFDTAPRKGLGIPKPGEILRKRRRSEEQVIFPQIRRRRGWQFVNLLLVNYLTRRSLLFRDRLRLRASGERKGCKQNQARDRKSTRLNSSHLGISYAV